jgi:CheY-like chemotaxis protein
MEEKNLNLKVLVVDDNKINRLLLQKVLSKWGVTSETAENGLEALDKIKSNADYDVVLMDVYMPEMSGIEATQAVRKLPEPYFKNLPIIALTALSESELSEIYEAGMNDFVLKPFDPQGLFNKLSKYQRV